MLQQPSHRAAFCMKNLQQHGTPTRTVQALHFTHYLALLVSDALKLFVAFTTRRSLWEIKQRLIAFRANGERKIRIFRLNAEASANFLAKFYGIRGKLCFRKRRKCNVWS